MKAPTNPSTAEPFLAVKERVRRGRGDYFQVEAFSDVVPPERWASLAVEEQFYVLFPTLILVAFRIGRGGYRAVVVCIAGVAVVSLGLSLWLTSRVAPWAFFGSPTRAWEFAAGGLASFLILPSRPGARQVAGLLCWSGLLAVLVAAYTFDRSTAFPGYAALLPVAGTAALLTGASSRPEHVVLRPLGTAPFQWLGRLSYSWYLWHWPFIVLGGIYLNTAPTISTRIALAMLALGVAWVTHVSVENRVRYSRWFSPRPIEALVLAAGLTAFSIGMGLGWRRVAANAARNPLQTKYESAHDDLPRIYADGCHLTFFEVTSPSSVYGDTSSTTAIVLFEDSHAAEWFPALEHIALLKRWRLISLTKSSCPSASLRVFSSALGRPYTECSVWRESALSRIIGARPKFVVMGNASQYLRADGIDPADWRDAEASTLRLLSAAKIPAFVLRDSPVPGFDVPTCASRLAWRTGALGTHCDAARETAIDRIAAAAEPQAVAHSRVARILDMSDAICGKDVCPAEMGGEFVYRDHQHLTASFATYLAPALIGRIEGRLRW